MPGRGLTMRVVKEFEVTLLNKPGALGAFDTAMGRVDVRVAGYAVHPHGDTAVMRFVADDAEAAEAWLRTSGYKLRVGQAIAIPGEDRPGFVGAWGQRFGAAGVNIEASYPANLGGRPHVVFAVSDIEAARKVASG